MHWRHTLDLLKWLVLDWLACSCNIENSTQKSKYRCLNKSQSKSLYICTFNLFMWENMLLQAQLYQTSIEMCFFWEKLPTPTE